ncbi:MarR family winged helix-turn-helix transcriptional regulator [Patulibacter americanus]|uniref:MarR family winged helix-turn-helix transcriptional regulator n=1 Tax=Patulibacter americanus TaxID=588672 RepID=UPI0003B2F609|nr:MarR family transcriptional regulator [Patulibacter americanus]
MTDHVAGVLDQWARERPDLDVSPMAVVGRVSRVSRRFAAETARTFAQHGLDHASFDVLATLRRAGPPYALSPTALTRSSMVTSGAISQRLDRLEARGLVVRRPRPTDGRGTDVALTDEGKALVDRALPDHLATEERLLAALSDEQRAELATLLSALLVSLE